MNPTPDTARPDTARPDTARPDTHSVRGSHPAAVGSDPSAAIGVADYPHRRAGHCGSGALRDLLEWAELSWDAKPLSEGSVFGLGAALDFTYLRGEGLGSPFYLVGRGAHLTTSLCARLDIDLEVRRSADPDIGWTWALDELAAGRPLLCWADMRELPYLRVRMHMSRHDIVITGYDPATDQVRVVDNDRDEPQHVPAAALRAARASTGFPEPTLHTCYPLRFPHTLPDRQRAVATACAQAVENMRHPRGDALTTDGAVVSGHGLQGLQVFLEDLQRWPELYPADAPDHHGLHAALTTLAVFIEKAGTGGALFRRLQAQYLTDLTPDFPHAAPAAAAYSALAHHWTRIAASAAGDPAHSVDRRWHEVLELAGEIPQQESDALDQLENLARAL